jgi:Tfp pilus assembly ATPase PilU
MQKALARATTGHLCLATVFSNHANQALGIFFSAQKSTYCFKYILVRQEN